MNRRVIFLIMTGIFLLLSSAAFAQQVPLPSVSLSFGDSSAPKDVNLTLQILFLLTVLTLAPSIVVMVTAFTRIVIVLSFIRQAMSTQQIPPNQVLVALALFLTFFVMSPVIDGINKDAYQPYMKGTISQEQAVEKSFGYLKRFMIRQTRPNDLALFVTLSKQQRPRNAEELSGTVLIPAFIISELKTAFQLGFVIFIPFLIIDMVVASTLISMGMLLLSPVLISFPFKILLFIMVDGWHLITRSLVYSFH